MSQRTVGIDPQALNALRREYDALPRDKHGKCVRGSIRELVKKHGIDRAKLYRLIREAQ